MGILETYRYLTVDLADDRVKETFTHGNPLIVLTILSIYLIFVLKIGPKYMETRKPYDLKTVLICYNMFLALINFSIFVMATYYYFWELRVNFLCAIDTREPNPTIDKLLLAGKIFYFVRYLELFDTVFFVLRKKNNQLSGLHVIHHTIVPFTFWILLTYLPIVHYTFGGYVNGFVHSIMYTYYMLSAIPQMRKYLWWKKHLTKIQLSQFIIIVLHSLWTVVSSCDVPKWFAFVVIIEAALFLILFSIFYTSTYNKKNHETKLMDNSREINRKKVT